MSSSHSTESADPSHFRRLAYLSDFRFIEGCPCNGGMLHLSWDVATLHLSLADFEWLSRVVAEAVERNRFDPPDAPFALWVGSAGLRMSRLEQRQLHQMIRTARQQLGQILPPMLELCPSTRLVN